MCRQQLWCSCRAGSRGEQQVGFWEVGTGVTQIFLRLSRWEAALGLQYEPGQGNPDVTPWCGQPSQAVMEEGWLLTGLKAGRGGTGWGGRDGILCWSCN